MKNQNIGLLILRLIIGILLIFHGINKIFNGVEWIAEMLNGKGIPGFLAYGVYIAEIVAPVMLIIGYRTRVAALLVVINFLVIIFINSPDKIPVITEVGAWALEKQGLYLFGSLTLFFTGGGKFGVSARSRWD